MARTAEGRDLSVQHRRGQLQIRAHALRNYVRLWPLWEGDETSFLRLADAAVPLVQVHHRLSSSLAGGYFDAFRKAEKVSGSAAARLAEPVDENRLKGSLIVTGRDMTGRAIAAGQSAEAAMQTALVRTSGTIGRFTLAGMRDTTVLSTAADKQAHGFARVTSGNCCAFCAMVASRGPVFSEDTADFEAHDHCACCGEPSYEGSEWPGRAREFHDLWNEHASGAENPLNEFRRVLDA